MHMNHMICLKSPSFGYYNFWDAKISKNRNFIARGNSMILTFHVPPMASGQGLYDIDGVQFRVTQKNFRKLGSP